MYPNPATSPFYVKAQIKTAHTLRVYTATGQLVKEQVTASSTTPIYTHGLLPVIYYLQIKGKEVDSQQAIWLR